MVILDPENLSDKNGKLLQMPGNDGRIHPVSTAEKDEITVMMTKEVSEGQDLQVKLVPCPDTECEMCSSQDETVLTVPNEGNQSTEVPTVPNDENQPTKVKEVHTVETETMEQFCINLYCKLFN